MMTDTMLASQMVFMSMFMSFDDDIMISQHEHVLVRDNDSDEKCLHRLCSMTIEVLAHVHLSILSVQEEHVIVFDVIQKEGHALECT